MRPRIFWWQPLPLRKNKNHELVLDRRRIYIFPNLSGGIFILVLLAIFITSVNYNINLGYGLDFLLISYLWLGIIFTYRNLAGLTLSASVNSSAFAGELAHLSIHINNYAKHARYAVAVGHDKDTMQVIDVAGYESDHLPMSFNTIKRGWMPCPKMRLQTSFPLGLLTAWTYWQPLRQILVFPAPELNPPPLPFVANGGSGSLSLAGNEEFTGIRNYQIGDSLKQLAWRQIARQSAGSNEHLISKQFEGGQQSICMLNFSELPLQLTIEQKLSRLCAWLLMAEQKQIPYAFQLGKQRLCQNLGQEHLQTCLTALALYHHE